MGTITFQLPAASTGTPPQDLEQGCVAGGPDNMPWPTEVQLEPGTLTLRRSVEESGFLAVPWAIDGMGRLMGTTATLMERPEPYHLQVELARGKVNQVRCQAADWQAGGLVIGDALAEQIRQATRSFGRAVTGAAPDQVDALAQTSLNQAYAAAEQLVKVYIEQVFQIRHQRATALETALGVRLGERTPQGDAANALLSACNSVTLPFSWHSVEPSEGSFFFEPPDALLDWALKHGLTVSAGPLIDFSSARLPEWLWQFENDLSSLSGFMCNYVETVVRRYRSRIRRWQLSAASNCANVLSLSEDELLWLTVRLAETARQVDSSLELVVGIAQPWGEYMATEERIHSPFIFADTLIRTGLNLAALDLEVIFGVTPRGSYCRDLLETSRLLDLYSLLGVPLRVTLGYPSDTSVDHTADPELRVAGGRWRDGFTPAMQAQWVAAYAALAVAKPYMQAVHWVQWSDAEPHPIPHCGLVDASGNIRPALQPLKQVREQHLR
jgi:hypothetical protein